jgi:hypothetical protein
VQVAAHARGNWVAVNNALSSTGTITQTIALPEPETEASRRWKFWAKAGGFIVGLASVAGVVW